MSLPERELTNLTWRTSRSRAVQHPFDRSRANERFDYYCCFKRGPINTILDEDTSWRGRGVSPRRHLTFSGVSADLRHSRAERLHPSQFDRVNISRDEYLYPDAPPPTGIGHRLTKVARGCANDALTRVKAAHDEVRAAPLEAAQGVRSLHLDHDLSSESGG